MGDGLVVARCAIDTKIAVYGPDATSTQLRGTVTLGRAYRDHGLGYTVFYSHDPMGGSPTPGIHQWSPPADDLAVRVVHDARRHLAGAHILRATPTTLLFSDTTDVFTVTRSAPGPRQMLFDNPTKPATKNVNDIRPARPRTLEGGVLVTLDDTAFNETGHDYFVDLSRPTATPKDLVRARDNHARERFCVWRRRSLPRRRHPVQPALHL